MIETQLVFKGEYRFDLKRIESVIIPYLFNNDTSLILSVDAKTSKNYRSVGRIDQSIIDYPKRLVASSQVVRFGNQIFQFPQQGRFQLIFYPNYYLQKTKISISKVFEQQNADMDFQNIVVDNLERIEQKINNL